MPLGGDNGALIIFGLTAVAVIVCVVRAQSSRRPFITGTLLGIACGAVVYALAAIVALATVGTNGYQFSTWLVVVLIGLIPAAVLGLIEGLAASLIFRLFA